MCKCGTYSAKSLVSSCPVRRPAMRRRTCHIPLAASLLEPQFFLAATFNGDISSWNVVSATDMSDMVRRWRHAESAPRGLQQWSAQEVGRCRCLFVMCVAGRRSEPNTAASKTPTSERARPVKPAPRNPTPILTVAAKRCSTRTPRLRRRRRHLLYQWPRRTRWSVVVDEPRYSASPSP
jgi:hypothetical protein